MKGKFRILGHVGLALFVACALMLAVMPAQQVEAATAVTDVWVEFPAQDASGSGSVTTYNLAADETLYRIHFKPTIALVAGVDTITIQFPDGVDTNMGAAGTTYAFTLGALCTNAAYFDIDPDGPGTTYGYDDAWAATYGGKRITVTTAVSIAAGQEAWLLIDDANTMVTGGAKNTTPYKVKVHTSKDTSPVLSKGFYLGTIAVTDATTDVSVSPVAAGAENAEYTCTFKISDEDPDITLTGGTDTITVTFPYGTTVPGSMSASAVKVWKPSAADAGDWHTCGQAPITDTNLRTVTVTIPSAFSTLTIGGTEAAWPIKVQFLSTAGITNPTTAYAYWGADGAGDGTASRVGFIRTSQTQKDWELDNSGYEITYTTAAALNFTYNSTYGFSDKYTMINMYSSKLYLQVEDAYGNLVSGGATATAEVTLSPGTNGAFFYDSDGTVNDSGTYTQISAPYGLTAGAATLYYKNTATSTYTLRASYGDLADATLTMQVCPGVSLFDRYDNLINTYAPTSALTEETAATTVVLCRKSGYYIQQALDAATDYDTVQLGDGRYEVADTPTTTDGYLRIQARVTLTSVNGADSTTIYDTGHGQSSYRTTIEVMHSSVTVDGLTVEGTLSTGGNQQFIRVGVTYQYCTISNCTIKGPSTYYPLAGDATTYGVILNEGGTAGSTVSNNTISNTYMGIYVKQSSAATSRHTISGNDISATVIGVNNERNNYTTLSDNIVSANYAGIQLYDSDYCTVSGNTVSGAFSGLTDGTYTGGGGIELVSGATDIPSANNTIVKNTISGCYYGIRVRDNTTGAEDQDPTEAACANNVVKYNDISGDTRYGIYNADPSTAAAEITLSRLDAKYNWFGDATGPTYTALTGAEISKSNPNGTGDAISDLVIYYPWLYIKATGTTPSVVADNVSWQTCTMKLVVGWNTLSTPVKLIEAADAIDELISSGMEIGFYYDDTGWHQIIDTYVLDACDAVYVKMTAITYVQLKFDASAWIMPDKELAVGWNLISLAYLDSAGKLADDAVASVALTAAGLPGYSQVISPSLNASQTDMFGASGSSWAVSYGQATVSDRMYAGLGYWIYMQNAATLAGFEITPIAPDLD